MEVAGSPVGLGAMPQDDVESIVEAWSRERPELDLGSIALTSRVLRLAHHFENAQQERLASLDLKPGWLDVLSGPGRRIVDAAVEAQQAVAERLLRPLGPDERQAVIELMRKLLIAFE